VLLLQHAAQRVHARRLVLFEQTCAAVYELTAAATAAQVETRDKEDN
jgi:hypothetical protein